MVRKLGLLTLAAAASLGLVLAGCGDDDNGTECGNGVMEGNESCDGSDLGTATCVTAGFAGGTLACNSTCGYDTSGCTNQTQECPNGTREGTEQCDGMDLGNTSCEDLNHTGGTLGCNADCTFDETGCTDEAPCGNNTREGTEQCDGADLANQTCEGLGHTGGTLDCNTDCTFDETGCVDTCGDNTLDAPYEVCDGTDFGTATCATEGSFDGGTLSCASDCHTINTSGCCADACSTAGVTCNGNTLETCTMAASGCLELTTEDCTATSGNICDDSGATAQCAPACVSDCTTLGDTQCTGDTLQTCTQVGSCMNWVDTDCTTALAGGYCGGTPAQCYANGTGLACDDVYNLNGRTYPYLISGTFDGGALTNPGSCQTGGANPLYLSYTLQGSDVQQLTVTLEDSFAGTPWPILSAWTSSEANRTFCNSANITEIGCEAASSRTVTLTIDPSASNLGAGDTIYFLASGDGASYYLEDDLVTVTEVDCAVTSYSASMIQPATTTNVDPRLPIVIHFTGDAPVQDSGTIELQENGSQVALYDLSTAPAEVTWPDAHTVQIVPATQLSTGVTVTVNLNLATTVCGDTVGDSFSFATVASLPPSGEDCSDIIPANNTGHTDPPAWLGASNLDVLTVGLVDCYGSYAGTVDSVWSFTMEAGMNAASVTIGKSADNRLVAVILDDCGSSVASLGCGSDYSGASLSLQAANLTPGQTYYLVIGDAYSGASWPDSGFTGFDIAQDAVTCGDGIIRSDFGEQCDDGNGNDSDGCSSTCQIESGWECLGAPSPCQPICGNGRLDSGEQCDDGNTAAGDGCDATCQIEATYECYQEPSLCGVPRAPAAAGELVITEIMQNPAAVGDTVGEWFEVYNPTTEVLDLDGAVISDNGTDHFTVTGQLLVPPGGYVVLGNNTDTSTNGGVTVDYAYAGYTLANGADEVIITVGVTIIDQVYYDGGPNFPDPSGASMSLAPTHLTATDNNTGANWCEAQLWPYGDGDMGSPGYRNEPCSALSLTTLLSEDFATFLPTGWAAQNGGDTPDTWFQCDPTVTSGCDQGSFANATPPFAVVNSDAAGSGTVLNEGLVTSPVDCSTYSYVTLSFLNYYRSTGGDVGRIQVSTDAGLTWHTVGALTSSSPTTDGEMLSADISAWAAGQSDVRVRFLYSASWDWYWMIDDVTIEAM